MSTPEDEEVLDKRTDVSARRRLVIYGIVLVAVFLIGLVPMWLVARSRGAERDAAQHELRLCQLENSLASAALDARRGEYEHARQAASGFFTSLREQVDLVKVPSDLTSQQREALRPILNQRDLAWRPGGRGRRRRDLRQRRDGRRAPFVQRADGRGLDSGRFPHGGTHRWARRDRDTGTRAARGAHSRPRMNCRGPGLPRLCRNHKELYRGTRWSGPHPQSFTTSEKQLTERLAPGPSCREARGREAA
jgi:hypothetical protein